MRKLIFSLMLVVGAVFGLAACDPPPKGIACKEIPFSSVPPGSSYSNDTWRAPDGTVIGYALEEDSPIYATHDAAVYCSS